MPRIIPGDLLDINLEFLCHVAAGILEESIGSWKNVIEDHQIDHIDEEILYRFMRGYDNFMEEVYDEKIQTPVKKTTDGFCYTTKARKDLLTEYLSNLLRTLGTYLVSSEPEEEEMREYCICGREIDLPTLKKEVRNLCQDCGKEMEEDETGICDHCNFGE